MKQYFSAKKLGFYPESIMSLYEQAKSLPDDLVEITKEQYDEFSGLNPYGKELSSSNDGEPIWADIPKKPNSELLKLAISDLNIAYQNDIEILNRAWLAAAVNDGVNESLKMDAVYAQINARKAIYATDKAEIIEQYPV